MVSRRVQIICAINLICAFHRTCEGLGEWYCGKENCYGLLGVPRNASLQEIRKAYRNASLTLHPDKNPSETAAAEFHRIANAYEILTDNNTRASYDYALAHPKEHLYNQYRYYRNRAYKEMKVPAQYTITGLILLWSLLQYFTKRVMYEDAMKKIRQSPKYRARMAQLLHNQHQSGPSASKGRKQAGKAPKLSDLSEEELEALEKQVDAEVKVQGGRSKPTIRDTLGFQLLLLPINAYKMLRWQAQWTWDYTIQKKPYDGAAQEFLTRDFLRMTADAWDMLEDKQREELLSKRLWVKDNQRAYQAQREKTMQRDMKRYFSR